MVAGFGCQVSGMKGKHRTSTLHETTLQKLNLDPFWATLYFVGWVEPTQGFLGFRCTQPNLQLAGIIAKCETQQRPISEPGPTSLYSN